MRNNMLLRLHGRFVENTRTQIHPEANINERDFVSSEDIRSLSSALSSVLTYWNKDASGFPPLVSVRYTRIIPKSLRMETVLSGKDLKILGVRYSETNPVCHIFTYQCSLKIIEEGIRRLDALADFLDASPFSGGISGRLVKAIDALHDIKPDDPKAESKKERQKSRLEKLKVTYSEARKYADAVSASSFSKKTFLNLIIEANVIYGFFVDEAPRSIDAPKVITLYDIGKTFEELKSEFGLGKSIISCDDNLTWLVTPAQYAAITAKAPFMISMSMPDMRDIAVEKQIPDSSYMNAYFTSPGNEPVIGVIDYPFDSSVPFASWVEEKRMIPADIDIDSSDFEHGTAVSSIIVDGPVLNPGLEDNCGRFRVRHFSVVYGHRFSAFSLMRSIRSIVDSNPDIRVWNLSLGADYGIDCNFISLEASMLDLLQRQKDILFVIAGTNNREKNHTYPVIGAPADSVNALVVNSVKADGSPASYTRKGPVLGFFVKPDLSAYGGDAGEEIRAWGSSGPRLVCGTSFAAPWIARKASFLIDKLGFSVQEAKALLIDSAAGWNIDERNKDFIGYGVVPQNINRIVSCPADEIRFILKGNARLYETVTNKIPVPTVNDKFPYIAKATLCYSCACNRNNGVDYTEDELDLHFGRLDKNGNKIIKTINDNFQNEVNIRTREVDARLRLRKWDNVKHITETSDKKMQAKSNKASVPYWGLKINKTSRLSNPARDSIPFCVVVTLRRMNGEDAQVNDFIRMCDAALWTVEKIDVEERLRIFEKVEEEIVFTD